MLFPDDSLLEAGAFRFGLAGVLELALTLEVFSWKRLADSY